jgi:hypothetical protein
MAAATPKAPDVDPFFFAQRVGPGPHGNEPLGATAERSADPGRARAAPAVRPGPAVPAGKRRKQWGGDRRTRALPMVPQPVSDRQVAMARLAIIVTVTAWLGYLITWFLR